MINYKKLLTYFYRYWWLMLIIPLIAISVTYYFVRELPNAYVSQTYISTGVAEATRVGTLQGVGYTQARQMYSNIIGMMVMKRIVNTVSYKLILHDLKSDSGNFRPHSDVVSSMTSHQREEAIQTFYRLLSNRADISAEDNIGDLSLYDVIASMGYAYGQLIDGLNIVRNGDSDFITVVFTSENPYLSAFVVNNLASEFIQDYHSSTRENDLQSVAMLDSLVKEKERVMQEKNDALRNYRVNSGILSSSTQSGVLYQQIAALETKRSDKLSEIESIQGTITEINSQLKNPDNDLSLSRASAYNNEIVMIDQQLELANRRYINNNFSVSDKRIVDSLQQIRKTIVASTVTNRPTENPQQSRQLLQQRLVEMQTSLSLARNGMNAIESDLATARGRYNAMVPMDAGLQNYERDAQLATDAYLEALNRYNQAGYVSNVDTQMKIVEQGVPGGPMPSKKLIYTALSGFASFMVCLVGVAAMALFDRRISTPEELELATQSKNLAVLSRIPKNGAPNTIQKIWKESAVDARYAAYRDQLRTLRFDLQRDILDSDYQIIGVTGVGEDVGKSFISGSLAYAFALTGKKVLIIGEDVSVLVKNEPLSDNKNANQAQKNTTQEFERFLIEREIQTEDLITNLRRNEESTSILEVQDRNQLMSGFQLLKEKFDLIIIDVGSFSNVNHVKEWLLFSDISVAVFEAGKKMPKGYKTYAALLKEHAGFKGWILNKV